MIDSFWEDVREGKSAQPRTAPAELVTEEMISRATAAYGYVTGHTPSPHALLAALAAVAPMIAARAIAAYKEDFMHAPWRTETKP